MGAVELTFYARDLVILCKTEQEARKALARLGEEMSERRLKLHSERTGVIDITQPGGFEFLGCQFERGKKRPRKKSLVKFKDKVRGFTRG